jgi:hypothetical protein
MAGDHATKSAKQVNVATTGRVVVVYEANAGRENHACSMSACVGKGEVVVSLMNTAWTDCAFVRQTSVTDAEISAKRTRSVWMTNAFANKSVKRVSYEILRLRWNLFSCSILPISMFEWRTMYGLLSMHLSARLDWTPLRTKATRKQDSILGKLRVFALMMNKML